MAVLKRSIELLREDPDDVERYLVVADQLQASGDPRGELIVLQAAAERTPAKEKTLRRAAEKHLKLHAKQLLGPLWTASTTCVFEWRLGFIRSATLWSSVLPLPPARTGRRVPKPRVNKLLKHTDELLRLESAVLLEHLTLASTFNGQLFLWDAAARVAEGAPPTLHRLDLRDLYERALPDWEPERQLELVWRGRVLTLRSDTLSLEAAAELFG